MFVCFFELCSLTGFNVVAHSSHINESLWIHRDLKTGIGYNIKWNFNFVYVKERSLAGCH